MSFKVSCSSAGTAGKWLEGHWFKSQLRAELSCMSKCPWARYWTQTCSWCAAGTLHDGLYHQWGPCDELVTCPPPESAEIGSSKNPRSPIKRDYRQCRQSGYRQWHDIYCIFIFLNLLHLSDSYSYCCYFEYIINNTIYLHLHQLNCTSAGYHFQNMFYKYYIHHIE